MSIREQVHCCLLETCANCCLLQSIQDGPYLGFWKFSCFQGTCVGRYISYGIYYLCAVFRAVRVLGKKGAVLLKWGFSPFTCCLFPHPILVFESAVFCGGDGQCPRKIDPMGVAAQLLSDGGVWGEKLNNF